MILTSWRSNCISIGKQRCVLALVQITDRYRSYISTEFIVFLHDTLSHIVSIFLRYPSSHSIAKMSLPPSFSSRLNGLGLVRTATSSEDTAPHDYKAEWSESERTIRDVFSTMSKTSEERISRQTTIFQLGLDSINAVQVAAMLRNKGFSGITATDVLENPTCAKLASKLISHDPLKEDLPPYDLAGFRRTAETVLQNAVKSWDSIEAVLPCTSLQMGMLSEFIDSKGKDYLNFISFRVDPGITATAIQGAWVALVQAYPILRMGFTPLDHEDASFAMLQYVFTKDAVPVHVQRDIKGFDVSAWQRRAARTMVDDLRRPLWQVILIDDNAGIEMHLAIHHGIYDAQSLHTLMNDLSKALRGEALSNGSDLDAAVQDIITQTYKCKKDAETFWKKHTAVVNKFPVMTSLTGNKRDILVRTFTSSLAFSGLEGSVKNAGFTIQAVAQAAWLRVLSSYLGESSVVFGTIFSGRNSEATHQATFPCITTLPVVADCLSSNRELVKTMMQYNTDLQRHQRTPLTDIQRWLGHANNKLFDTLLVYQKFEHELEQQQPWRVVDETAAIDYPVSVEIEPHEDLVELRITFFSDVLPTEQAEILLRQFDAVFSDLAQSPDGSDDGLVCSHPELFAVLPAEEPELKSDVTFLHEFVQVSAQKYPNGTALDFVSGFEDDRSIYRRWTYRQLDECGNKVAHMLSTHVKTGDIVAVCFDKCPEAHFAMLGILKAGCAFLALDPGAPASRKAFILQDSGAVAILTDRPRSINSEFEVLVPVVVVDEETMTSASSAPPALARPLTPEDRSYCLYTSGTTGTPKGCEITHENAVQAMLAFQKLFEGHWDQDSKWLQFASYHFDVSVLEQYWTWSVGIPLIAAPRDVVLEDLAGTIARLEITHIDLTPSLARLVHPDDVPSLCRGVFITGGEQLKKEILDVWGPKHVIHNFYGPTEATIGVTSYPCVPINGRSSNIGRQFANVGCYVLRPGTQIPVLRGSVGELCVSGKLVGKGYLNRDELTAERFPTLEAFGERVYRTGDLVRVLHNGCFDFLGRADDQVKLRGQRLEIGEVNQCVREGVDEVADVVTMVVRNEKQQKDLLVSFIVMTRDTKTKELHVIGGDEAASISQKVQRACRDRLPGYMIPTYVLVLPFVPLSPNNKAEFKELRALFNKLSPEQLVAPSAPSNAALGDVGRRMYTALSTMSCVPKETITPTTNIFELGVDSITVLRFVRALKREGIKHASATVILKNPIIADLAHALQSSRKFASSDLLDARQTVEACQHRHRGLACRVLGVTPDLVAYVAPCSALQQGMISRSGSDGNEEAYFNTFRFDLAEKVVLAKLRSAWEGLIRDSSVLKTKFVSTMDGYIQVALKDAEVSWTEVVLKGGEDLDTVLGHRRKAWVERNSQDIDHPIELLIVTASGKRTLVLHIFHGVYDATSFDLMIDDISRRYKNNEKEQDAPSFLDALLHGPLRDHSFCKSFWTEHLRGVSLSPLPQMSEQPSAQYLSVSRRVPSDGLDKIRKELGVTQQAIFQAIWSTVLQRYFSAGVTFGIIVSGRSIELDNVDRTIGPLFNTVAYHHRIDQRLTWSSSIRRCHEFNTAILEFQHVPLRDVQKWCSGGRPLFDTLFSFQKGDPREEHGDLWTEVESDVNPDYPLAFEATLLPDGGLRALIVAQRGVTDEHVLEGMLDEFEEMIRATVNDRDSLVYSCSSNACVLEAQESGDTRLPQTENTLLANESSSFEWTSQGKVMRKEISLLADVDEATITSNTSLLELGLDSIDTIKLSARLRQAGIVLSNSELIKGQSIAHLLIILREKEVARSETHDSGYTSDDETSSVILQKHLAENGHDLTNVDQVLPPTPLQDSMVSEMILSEFQRYFNHDVLELSPEVDLERLESAWVTVIKSSPILRTVFVEVASPSFDFAYAQLVKKYQSETFERIEIQSLNEVSLVINQARAKAFKAQGHADLLQVTFAKTSQKTYVVLSIAHALYDGWSLGLLHQDVEAAYRGTYSLREEYTRYLGNIIQASGDDGQMFWVDYMSDARPTVFPSGHEQSVSNVNRAEVRLRITTSTLTAFCKRHAISQQAVAQACWASTLATHCQRLDVTFGVVLSGRETEASEAMLFPTMNTVPVRAVFHGSTSGFLRYLQDNVTSIRQFQHFPLRKIRALVKDGQASLFNTLFILQKSNGRLSESGAPLMRSVEGSSSVEYPVCVEMEIDGEHVIWRTACDDSYLSFDETSSLLRELETVLEFLISSDDRAVLAFGEDGVSICGLPAFQPKEQQNQQEDPYNMGETDGVWSTAEETIRNVLAEFSKVDSNSITKSHNVYHLGIDSIGAIKVSSALRKKGVTVPVRDMIQSASIAEMAVKASGSSSPLSNEQILAPNDLPEAMTEALKRIELDLKGIGDANIQQTLPATAMQTHMLSVWQNTKGSVFFPEFRYKLFGISNRISIDNAWRGLVERQPILRTVFLATGFDALPFVMVVLRPDSTIDNPFVQLKAQSQKDGSWLVRLRIQHALYDGVSLPLLMVCFIELLRGNQAPGGISDQSIAWKNHITSSLHEALVAKRKTFWQSYLQATDSTRLEIRGATAAPTAQRACFLRRAAIADTACLRSLCAKNGISIQAVFLAAYAKVLVSRSGREDNGTVVFGVYLANRDTTPTVHYPTLCLVPLRVEIPRKFRLVEVAASVQRDLHLISDPAHVGVGLWEVREWTGVVVDSFVNFLSLPEGEEQAAFEDVRLSEVGFGEDVAMAGDTVVMDPDQLHWLEKNAVRDAYPVSLWHDPALKIDE